MMRRTLILAMGTIALVLAGAQAQAQRTLSMSGQWYQNRGPLVDIPINGGPVGCAGNPASGCAGNLRPLGGGIPAANVLVPASGTGPASFSINNSNAFGQPGGPANRQTVGVPIPTVIQLASQFSLMGPGLLSTAGGTMASFKANAWSLDPQQAARLQPNFTWCPPGLTMSGTMTVKTGPGGPCLTVSSINTYGPLNMKFSYTAGTNAFGGTMSMMLRDTAVVSINFGGKVLHQLVGGVTNPTFGPQMGGGGYPAQRTLTLAPGPLHSTFMTNPPCLNPIGAPPNPPGCGIITQQGAQTATLPGELNFDWGMPWTTGVVKVAALAGPNPANDPATTFTVMGSDSRTPLGRGQITMVAGQLTERRPSGNSFAALDIVVMDFSAASTPLLSGPAIVAMVALMLLAGGYMARRHFATDAA